MGDIEFEGDRLKEGYFERYEGIYAEISQATRFDKSTDLSMTYLSRIDTSRDMAIKAEENTKFLDKVMQKGILLDNTECNILLDT